MEKQDHSLPMKRENAPYEDLKSRRTQLYSLIRQSFDIFNIYGKDPASIENIMLGFNLALEGQSIEDIQLAFKDWMKSSSAMPTPADILKLSQERRELRGSRQGTIERPQAAPRVYGKNHLWVYKEYSQAVADGSLNAYFAHWLPQTEKNKYFAYEWLKYAHDFLKYPKEIAEQFARQAGLKTG